MPAGEAPTSKSFRAVLSGMTPADVEQLAEYCALNFASSAVFTDDGGAGPAQVVWLATRDRTRTALSHRSSARAVLRKLKLPSEHLKGTWLVLAADDAVRAAAERRPERRAAGQHRCLQLREPRTPN